MMQSFNSNHKKVFSQSILRGLIGLMLLFFTLLLFTATVAASGKMEVALGEQVILEAESLTVGREYKWVVTKAGDILNTQEGNVFDFTFDQQGEHIINLAVEDPFGISQNTTVHVMVGGRYSTPVTGDSGTVFDVPLRADLSTLPAMDENGTVRIVGDRGYIAFDIAPRADVLEFRLDRNIYVDSDQNGIPNDDIDNADDPSYLRGGIWQAEYRSDESTDVVAELTVVNTSGSTSKTQVDVQFVQPGSTGELEAVLDTLPPRSDNDGKIYVYNDQGKVAFYARRSQGDILEYRIDANIYVDSDGDGVPDNDIDNRTDDSFETGDVWVTPYKNTDEPVAAQLIVVRADGKGSVISREVVFIDRPSSDSGSASDGSIQLNADKSLVLRGDPITFVVDGLEFSLDNYTFEWDFNGDTDIDQTIEGDNQVTYIYDVPGLQQASVRVQDQDGNRASFTKEIQVNDLALTTANFEYVLEGKTVQFQNTSTVGSSVESQSLSYKWNFGETDEVNYAAQNDQIGVENPTYSYLEPGNYSITLTVTDADGGTDTKATEIILEGVSEVDAPADDSEGSLLGMIFRVILYLLLIVVILILTFLVGMLTFLKVKHPDLVFEELIDELKLKILRLLGMQDALDDEFSSGSSPSPVDGVAVTGGKIPPYHPKNKPLDPPQPKSVSEKVQPETSKKVPPKTESKNKSDISLTPKTNLDNPNAPVPDWLKKENRAPITPPKKTVIEAESEVIEPEKKSSSFQANTTKKPPVPTVSQAQSTQAKVAPKPLSTSPKSHQNVPPATSQVQKPPLPKQTPLTPPVAKSSSNAAPQSSPSRPQAESGYSHSTSSQSTQASPSADFSQKKDEKKEEDLSGSDGPVPEWLKK